MIVLDFIIIFQFCEPCRGDPHSSMPEVWCACCRTIGTEKLQAKSIESQDRENVLLSIPEEYGNGLDGHLNEYRQYVNSLCNGGWYTVTPPGQNTPRLDHLFDKPIKKVSCNVLNTIEYY